MTICRSCGEATREPTALALEFLGVSLLPDWLRCLCLDCLYDLSSDVAQDEQGNVTSSVTPENLNAFLTLRLGLLASRVAGRRPVDRCEIMNGGHFIGDPDDMRCRRFATREWLGRRVCWACFKRLDRGRDLPFIGSGYVRPKIFVIWARDADELVSEAAQRASAFPNSSNIASSAPNGLRSDPAPLIAPTRGAGSSYSMEGK